MSVSSLTVVQGKDSQVRMVLLQTGTAHMSVSSLSSRVTAH